MRQVGAIMPVVRHKPLRTAFELSSGMAGCGRLSLNRIAKIHLINLAHENMKKLYRTLPKVQRNSSYAGNLI
jgi:hypothetical protein